jgi:hypothetical protein
VVGVPKKSKALITKRGMVVWTVLEDYPSSAEVREIA